jgi:hypothetical protein
MSLAILLLAIELSASQKPDITKQRLICPRNAKPTEQRPEFGN